MHYLVVLQVKAFIILFFTSLENHFSTAFDFLKSQEHFNFLLLNSLLIDGKLNANQYEYVFSTRLTKEINAFCTKNEKTIDILQTISHLIEYCSEDDLGVLLNFITLLYKQNAEDSLLRYVIINKILCCFKDHFLLTECFKQLIGCTLGDLQTFKDLVQRSKLISQWIVDNLLSSNSVDLNLIILIQYAIVNVNVDEVFECLCAFLQKQFIDEFYFVKVLSGCEKITVESIRQSKSLHTYLCVLKMEKISLDDFDNLFCLVTSIDNKLHPIFYKYCMLALFNKSQLINPKFLNNNAGVYYSLANAMKDAEVNIDVSITKEIINEIEGDDLFQLVTQSRSNHFEISSSFPLLIYATIAPILLEELERDYLNRETVQCLLQIGRFLPENLIKRVIVKVIDAFNYELTAEESNLKLFVAFFNVPKVILQLVDCPEELKTLVKILLRNVVSVSEVLLRCEIMEFFISFSNGFPSSVLAEFKPALFKVTGKLLNDHKRVVREKTSECRNKWFLLD